MTPSENVEPHGLCPCPSEMSSYNAFKILPSRFGTNSGGGPAMAVATNRMMRSMTRQHTAKTTNIFMR